MEKRNSWCRNIREKITRRLKCSSADKRVVLRDNEIESMVLEDGLDTNFEEGEIGSKIILFSY